jgi:hypothetical protein
MHVTYPMIHDNHYTWWLSIILLKILLLWYNNPWLLLMQFLIIIDIGYDQLSCMYLVKILVSHTKNIYVNLWPYFFNSILVNFNFLDSFRYMTCSISYGLSNLVWIEGMQINEWMNEWTVPFSPYSVHFTSWHNVWPGWTLTESQLRILKVHLGWLQLLICRGRGLRHKKKKITCN